MSDYWSGTLENYIKLPPIPDSLGNEELLFLWEYAKESDEDKKTIQKYLKTIIDNDRKCKTFEILMKQIAYCPEGCRKEEDAETDEVIVELLRDMQKHIFYIVCQTYDKIQRQYYDESKDFSEIACEIGVPEEWIEMVIHGFERR